jgi:hypothetical protein
MTVFAYSGGVSGAEMLSIGDAVVFGDMAELPAVLGGARGAG